MIQSVIFTNRFGKTFRCELGDSVSNGGIAITNITGIGPGASDIHVSEIATSDGGLYRSSRNKTRHITFNITLVDYVDDLGYHDAEEARMHVYDFFHIKHKIRAIFVTDKRNLGIYGYVDTLDVAVFSSSETVQISLTCPEYYFYEIGPTGDSITADIPTAGMFEFPFSNESLRNPLIQFGDVDNVCEFVFDYGGDAETGFDIVIEFLGSVVSELTITNRPYVYAYDSMYPGTPIISMLDRIRESNVIDWDSYVPSSKPVSSWHDESLDRNKVVDIKLSKIQTALWDVYQGLIYAAGAKIVISSEIGQKSVTYITPNGDSYNIIDVPDPLDWIVMYPGANEFSITVNNGSRMDAVKVSFSYKKKFSGV